MRRTVWVILVAAITASVWLFLPSRRTASESNNLGNSEPVATALVPLSSATQIQPGLRESPGGHTRGGEAASAEDGFVEVRVAAVSKPVIAAQVRLYQLESSDLATVQTRWRLAGLAVTGSDGVGVVSVKLCNS